jgi:tripartite-type tricarboxylate transporter receptor subunit TctC
MEEKMRRALGWTSLAAPRFGAPPDGYALLMSNTTIAMPNLFAKLPFDIRRNLLPISLIAIGPSLLAAHPSLPAKNVKDLIALAKEAAMRRARKKDRGWGEQKNFIE